MFGQMPHAAHRFHVFAAAERLERCLVALAHQAVDLLMERQQALGRQPARLRIHLRHEITEIDQPPAGDLSLEMFQRVQFRAQHQADVGHDVLVIAGEAVIPGRIQHGVDAAEPIPIELRAQGARHRRLDRDHARPIERAVVAPACGQQGLVDVDDHRGSGAQRRALALHPAQEFRQRGPAVGLIEAISLGDGQLLILFRTDEAPAGPARVRAEVGERAAIVEHGVADVHQLGQRRPTGQLSAALQ